MKIKLKEITDATVSELLCNEIILPSNYFQCFDKHAKTIEINIDSKEFDKELNEFILEEFNTINTYVNNAVKTIDNAAELTQEAQEAIKNNNTLLLKNLYNQINQMKKELEDMTNNIYKDYLTKVYNRKWLYHKYLNKEANYKHDTIIVLIDVMDYEYISKTYNKLISDNLLIYISTYLQNKLKEENIDFEIARYLTDKFIIAINKEELIQIENIIANISRVLYETTLKSNSGIMIKPTFEFSTIKVKKDDSFHQTLDTLIKKINLIKKT